MNIKIKMKTLAVQIMKGLKKIFFGLIIGWLTAILAFVVLVNTNKVHVYRCEPSELGVITQQGFSDTYVTVVTNSYKEYLEQELNTQ